VLCPIFLVDFVISCSISRKAAYLCTIIVEKPAHLGSIEQEQASWTESSIMYISWQLWPALFSVHFSLDIDGKAAHLCTIIVKKKLLTSAQ
jgi:hypothetical protein